MTASLRPEGPLALLPNRRLSHHDRHVVANAVSCYEAFDVAGYYGLDLKQVQRLVDWACDVDGCPGSSEMPNIPDTKTTRALIVADAQLLANRGWSMSEIADYFGVTDTTVRFSMHEVGRPLRLHDYWTLGGRGPAGSLEPGREVVGTPGVAGVAG